LAPFFGRESVILEQKTLKRHLKITEFEMTFVKKTLELHEQDISPTLVTPAIHQLQKYFETRFSEAEPFQTKCHHLF
jgi:hypothetical protein